MEAVTEKTFAQEVLRSEIPVIVDFWATWCKPCQALMPILEQKAAANAGKVKFVKVNVEQEGELASRYGVQGLPTLLVFKGGKPCFSLRGKQSEAQIEALIAKLR